MSVISDFSMSPPISVSGVESVVSDIESTNAMGEDRNSAALTPIEAAASKYLKANKDLALETPAVHEGFDFNDGDACILAGNTLVATHKYLLKRFKKLGGRISDGVLVLGSEDPGIEDFRNTLKILYASVIEESCEFDPAALTSALRLATSYEYPALRTFAINRLQDASLSAIDRIRLAREFGLSTWEEPAYIELCERDQAITTSEASVLGLNAFVHLARIREQEQRRRGRDVDAVVEDDESDSLSEGEVEPAKLTSLSTSNFPTAKSQRKRTRRSTKSMAAGVPKADNKQSDPQASLDQKEGLRESEKETVGASMRPSFINTTIPETHDCRQRNPRSYVFELSVNGCTCTSTAGYLSNGGYHGGGATACRLPACAVRAFKDLQTRQVAHATSIAHLETVITQLQTPPAAPPESPTNSASPELTASESIQEEVRKWLDKCRAQVECE